MSNKTLSPEQSETIFLMAYILAAFGEADGYYDMGDAMDSHPETLNTYIHYGSAALQAYLKNKIWLQSSEHLRDILIAAMNEKDGHEALPTDDPRLKTYSNYATAAMAAIDRYRENPVIVVVEEETRIEEFEEKAVESGWPAGLLVPVH